MSSETLKEIMADVTPDKGHKIEDQTFVNALFRVLSYRRTPDYKAEMELKLSPPVDQY